MRPKRHSFYKFIPLDASDFTRSDAGNREVTIDMEHVLKNSQKLYRFFTDFFTAGEGVAGFAWTGLDWPGLGATELDLPSL